MSSPVSAAGQFITVEPGLSDVVASGPQYGVKYVLTGMQGDGSRVVLNDDQDPDYIGWLTNLTGLDAPEVRESADDLIGDDGGIHGDFWHGRRPIVLEGQIDNRPAPHHYSFRAAEPTDHNYISNPSFADPAGFSNRWARYGGNTWSAKTMTDPGVGMRVTATKGGTSTAAVDGVMSSGETAPALPGVTYTLRFNFTAADVAAQGVRAGIEWLDVDTNPLGTIWGDYNTATSGELVISGQAVTSAATCRVHFAIHSNVANDTVDYTILNAILTEGTMSFFDGDSYPLVSAPYTTRWVGTPHASWSLLAPVEPEYFDGGRVRNIRMTRLQQVTNAMRKDMQMRWTPEGGVEQVVYLRRQQPIRIAGAYNKTFQCALVSSDPRIYAAQVKEHRFFPNDHDEEINNDGTIRTQPVSTIYGPTSGTMTGIELHNHSTGQFLVLAPGYALGPNQSIVFDHTNKTIMRENGTNIYDQLQFATSSWWQVEPGPNNIALHGSGTTTGASMVLRWQDAWV